MITETLAIALATLFATVSPIDLSAVFAALTRYTSEQQRRQIALRAVLVASCVLLSFALLGEVLLAALGISIAALKTAGGIILLLIGIDMVFGKQTSSAYQPADNKVANTQTGPDISIFPLAMPLIAGPGSMGALIVLMQKTEGQWILQSAVILALVAIMVITLICLMTAASLQQRLGSFGIEVVARVMGVILCALAIQFLFDGIAQSGLLYPNHAG